MNSTLTKYNNKTVEMPRSVLLSVSKPGRYTGGEYNSVLKDPEKSNIRFAFCFPDIYEIGMSHAGTKILYHLINERSDTYCERCFMPWTDMFEKMKEEKIPLFSLETKTPLTRFDFLGFTLQYEMCYTNMLAMLDLAGIKACSEERDENSPLVVAGGPCAFNPEPMADFIDIVFLGESEEQINIFLDFYAEYKERGKNNKKEFLEEVSKKVEGAYVPSLYEHRYKENNILSVIQPIKPHIPAKVRKAVINDPDSVYFPTKTIIPNIEAVHDRIFLEVFRGCPGGCRFCQAGFITRPVREKSPETLLKQARESQKKTGYDEIGLLSLSTGNYSKIGELTESLAPFLKETQTGISLPSLRVDSFSLDLMEKSRIKRKSGLTFAPEAGTDRLRKVINKNITDAELFDSVRLAFQSGRSNLKLYFMIGLPTETYEDLDGIVNIIKSVEKIYRENPGMKRRPEITVSIANFIPKPFTPFQWEPQDSYDTLVEKQQYLREKIKSKCVKLLLHDAKASVWEGVLARGDRRLSDVILQAYKRGCMFDSWEDEFDFLVYEECMEENNLDIFFYTQRKRDYSEVLPWSVLNAGIKEEYLVRENKRAHSGIETPPCNEKCTSCGASDFVGGGCC